MNKLVKHFDTNLDEIEDDERGATFSRTSGGDRVVADKGRVSIPLMLMDGRSSGGPPLGQYYTRDSHGRPNGVGDVQAELRRVGAYEDYCARLASAHKKLVPLRDGKPTNSVLLNSPAAADGKDTSIIRTLGDPRLVAYAAYVRRLAGAHKHA